MVIDVADYQQRYPWVSQDVAVAEIAKRFHGSQAYWGFVCWRWFGLVKRPPLTTMIQMLQEAVDG